MKPFLFSYLSEALRCRPRLRPLHLIKYYRRWRYYLCSQNTALNTCNPWITFSATEVIRHYLHENAQVFEYGSGGSTLFFLSAGAQVTSVEHDQSWFVAVSSVVEKTGLVGAWTGFLKEPTKLTTWPSNTSTANPNHYISSCVSQRGLSFKRYVETIDKYPDGNFHIVLIDGRSRASCLKHAPAKIQQGGLLILDNSDRHHYLTRETTGFLSGFALIENAYGPTPMVPFFTQTSVWVKIK